MVDNLKLEVVSIQEMVIVIYLITLGIKWLGCEADHSPPFSAKVKNAWSCTSTLPIHLHVMMLN
jgi:hypothetical protein